MKAKTTIYFLFFLSFLLLLFLNSAHRLLWPWIINKKKLEMDTRTHTHTLLRVSIQSEVGQNMALKNDILFVWPLIFELGRQKEVALINSGIVTWQPAVSVVTVNVCVCMCVHAWVCVCVISAVTHANTDVLAGTKMPKSCH